MQGGRGMQTRDQRQECECRESKRNIYEKNGWQDKKQKRVRKGRKGTRLRKKKKGQSDR